MLIFHSYVKLPEGTSISQRFHRRNHCRLAASCTAVAQTGSRHQKLRRRTTFGRLLWDVENCWEWMGIVGTYYDNLWQYYLLRFSVHIILSTDMLRKGIFHRPLTFRCLKLTESQVVKLFGWNWKPPLIFAHDSHVQTQQAACWWQNVAECHMPTMWNIYIHQYTSYIR
jgi:hypothetical protein